MRFQNDQELSPARLQYPQILLVRLVYPHQGLGSQLNLPDFRPYHLVLLA